MLLADPSLKILAAREIQKSVNQSAKALIEKKIIAAGVDGLFDMQAMTTKPKHGNGQIIYAGLQEHTSDSIKSMEDVGLCWVEESQSISQRSLEILKPTIRAAGSKLIFTWNPSHADAPVEKMFRDNADNPDYLLIPVNYDSNPFFTKELEGERLESLTNNPHRYPHIWLGHFEPEALNALWSQEMIAKAYVQPVPPEDAGQLYDQIIVSVDPAISKNADSNETGIIVAELIRGDVNTPAVSHVLEDASLSGTPIEWAREVVAAYDKWGANRIIIEGNQGGEMVKSTIDAVRYGLPIKTITATKSKSARAEPIAALYSAGRIKHAGTFTELEKQMKLITSQRYEGSGSPDRLDANVHAQAEFFNLMVRAKPKMPAFKDKSQEGW